MKEEGIRITDFEESDPKIELLIGADHYGHIITGKMCLLKCGLTAIETYFGWMVMGKGPGARNYSTATLVTSLLVREATVSELWSLDSLGIKDPIEVKTREELEVAALAHFKKTVRQNEEGRYEVHLPWLEGHEELRTNFETARRRCSSLVDRLVRENRYEEYTAVLREWIDDGVIEIVSEMEVHYPCHYYLIEECTGITLRPPLDQFSMRRVETKTLHRSTTVWKRGQICWNRYLPSL